MTKPQSLPAEEQELRQRVKRNMDRVQNVPALSNVVTKIISLADNPTVSGQQVAEVVGKDQSMVTAILKIVNSTVLRFESARLVDQPRHRVVGLSDDSQRCFVPPLC